MHLIDANKTLKIKAGWELHKNAACCFEQILEAITLKTAAIWPPTSHLTNHPNEMNKAFLIELKKQVRTHKRRSLMESYIVSRQSWPTRKILLRSRSVRTLDVVKRTHHKQWTIGTDGERERVRVFCVISTTRRWWWLPLTGGVEGICEGQTLRGNNTKKIFFNVFLPDKTNLFWSVARWCHWTTNKEQETHPFCIDKSQTSSVKTDDSTPNHHCSNYKEFTLLI